jgi:hypothetical protein
MLASTSRVLLLVCLLVAACVGLSICARPEVPTPSGKVAVVSTDQEFLSALQNHEIGIMQVPSKGLRFRLEFWKGVDVEWAIVLTRNVTIQGDSSLPILNLMYVWGAIKLLPGNSLVLKDILSRRSR